MIEAINPQVKALKHIESSLYLTDSLTEVNENEDDMNFLDEELKDILNNKHQYKRDAQKNLKKLEIFQGIFTDLVGDMMKSINKNKKEISEILRELSQ